MTVFGLWSLLPGWLHALGLVACAGLLLWALWHGRGAYHVPARDAGIRRLERTSGVDHRPLSTVLDRPAVDDVIAGAVWRVHVRRVRALLARLHVGWPESALWRRDPLAVRAGIVLLLLVGVIGAGDRLSSHVTDAFAPDLSAFAAAGPGQLTAWIDPPEYTGLAPVFLTEARDLGVDASLVEARDAPLTVVAGSVLVARVHGGGRLPTLHQGAGEAVFVAESESEFALDVTLEADTALTISQGTHALGEWDVRIVHDLPPVVALADEPEATRRSVLTLAYEASDDFGLAGVSAEIDRPGEAPSPVAKAVSLSLPLPGVAPAEAAGESYHDLTPHPWAGMPVNLILRATDTAGQTGETSVLNMVLPEREFRHPVAAAIVEQRRILALTPERVEQVRDGLASIAEEPLSYAEDVVVYLGLTMAAERLLLMRDADGLQPVVDLLWDTALRVEDGALSLAEDALRQAEEALREALAENADSEVLAELMEQLKEALDEYLEALADAGENQSPLDPNMQATDPDANAIDREDLHAMIDQARDMAMTGAPDAAQEMLNELQRMLENLQSQSQLPQAQDGEGDPILRELQEIMTDQDQLMNETLDQAQSGKRGRRDDDGQGGGTSGAEVQESLRRQLGNVMRGVGESGGSIPGGLGRAERAMREAREQLRGGRPDRAVGSQAEALQQLQEGAGEIIERMMGQGEGNQPSDQGFQRSNDGGRDPLGRVPPNNRGNAIGRVDIPEVSDVQRSREILDELYRRAGERSRSEEERDYIQRLLRWY
ncbi:MAG: DUF4175 family protein, partial [Alphaproteobacteria bacterium]|nr:DUF4175 family protein [Alphaproteobacteria bacterium]